MKIDKQLLEKYFKGNCTAEEADQVAAYLTQPDTPEADDWFNATYREVESEDVQPTTQAIKETRTTIIYSRWYSIAAAIAVLVGVCTWLLQTRHRNGAKVTLALTWDTLANHDKSIKLMTMTDGSRVWLAPHSSIVYPNNYNDTSREVWLHGEAFFEVAQHSEKTFSVHTGHLKTIALGTSFNISTGNYADGSIQVSLKDGKVAVINKTFSLILRPGEMVRCSDSSYSTPIAFSTKEVMDWRNGKLVFDKTALGDVFAKLQSRYGCKIMVDQTVVKSQKVSGVFRAGAPVQNILEAIQFVHGFEVVKIDENTYEITTGNN
ncbi:FecR family protein [Chitinophaga rhizophila]|uniref:FecR domain-containing protein n=1 Tax=Chitinophaga rhizophila TaxID=2866212 RepID=A0ABS7G968_9BACT|nr:FecR domain-containing protein [Chitinophaga rhizophila]MBW8684203.1 FecR domain-containing protein [Chitinophaga rhizophila]